MTVAPTSAAPPPNLAPELAAGAVASGIPSFPALLAQHAGLISSLPPDEPASPTPASSNLKDSPVETQTLPALASNPSLEPFFVNPIPAPLVAALKAVPASVSPAGSAALPQPPLSMPAVQPSYPPAAHNIPAGQEPGPPAAMSIPTEPTGGAGRTVSSPNAAPVSRLAASAWAPSPAPDSKSPQPPSDCLAADFLASLQPPPPSPSAEGGRGSEISKPSDQPPAQPAFTQVSENAILRPENDSGNPSEPARPARTPDTKFVPAWFTLPVAPPRPFLPPTIEFGLPSFPLDTGAEQAATGPQNPDRRSSAGAADAARPIGGNPQAPGITAESTGFDLFWRTFASNPAVVSTGVFSNAAVPTGNLLRPIALPSTPDVATLALAPAQHDISATVPQTQKPGVDESPTGLYEPPAEGGATGKSSAAIVPNAPTADQSQDDDQPSGQFTGHSNPEPSPHAPPAFVTGSAESNQPFELPPSGQGAEHASSALQAQPVPAEPASIANPRSARELSLRLEQDNAPAVSLSLTERGGAVHVAVRTADAGLGSRLQSNLDQLMVSLRHQGVDAEAGKAAPPDAPRSQPGGGEQTPFDSQSRSGSNGSGNRQRQRRNRTLQPAEGTGKPFNLQIPD